MNSEGHIASVTLKMVCPLHVMVSKFSLGPATHSATTTMEAFNWSTLGMTKLVSLLNVCWFKVIVLGNQLVEKINTTLRTASMELVPEGG